MIRTIIGRMSLGSWLIELWSLLIVSALLVVAADPDRARFAWLALFMAIAFWLLDTHVVRQGRLYSKMYDQVRDLDEAHVDFSMDTALAETEGAAFSTVAFSRALAAFHGVVIAAIAVTRALLHWR
jgi:hypothetical protein